MAFSIDNFSTYFCWVFSTPVRIPSELDLESFQIGVNPEILSEIIKTLYEMFREEFYKVTEGLAVTEIDSKSLLKSAIARCITISEQKTPYAHFMLVCTLINRIICEWFQETECFLLSNMFSCCLVSVYEKFYKDHFDNKEEGETLDFYIRDLMKQLATREKALDEYINDPKFSKNDASSAIKSYDNLVNPLIQDCEQRMLKDKIPTVSVEFDWNRRSSSESESSCGDNSQEDATECVPMDEDSSELTSKPSESKCSPCKDIDGEEETKYVTMNEYSSESTRNSPKSSFGKDLNTENEMECTTIYEDTSESTSKPSEPSSDKDLRKHYLDYKNRTCDTCKERCANFMVSYIENILEKYGK